MTDRDRLAELIEAQKAFLRTWGDGTIVTETAAGPLFPWFFPAIVIGLTIVMIALSLIVDHHSPDSETPSMITKKVRKMMVIKAAAVASAGLLITSLGVVVLATMGPVTTVEKKPSAEGQETQHIIPAYELLASGIVSNPEIMRAEIVFLGTATPLVEHRKHDIKRLIVLPEKGGVLIGWAQQLVYEERPRMRITYSSGEQAALEAVFNSDDKLVLVEPPR